MLGRFGIAVAGLLSVGSGAAVAADLPVKARPVPVPVMTWTGCYIGGNFGGAAAKSTWNYPNINPYDAFGPAGPIINGTTKFDNMSGLIGGGQIGCNYQVGSNFVVGIEGTFSGSNVAETNQNAFQLIGPGAPTLVTTKVDMLGTVTGRLGYAFDQFWMVYGKGGWAAGHVKTAGTITGIPADDFTTSAWHTNGWTVGTGVEYRATKNIVLGFEYDFYRLQGKDHTGLISGPGVGPANQAVHNVGVDIHAVTARASWLFGTP